MDKKPAELVNTVMAETPTDPAKRGAREAFVDNWKKRNPDFAKNLNKLSKAKLIHLLIEQLLDPVFDIAYDNSPANRQTMAVEYAAISLNLVECLLRGTHEEKHLALDRWKAEMIRTAGNNIAEVAERAEIAGATRVQIDEPLLAKRGRQFSKKGRQNGAVSKATRYINDLVENNPTLSAKELFEKADKSIIGNMTSGTFGNKVSEARKNGPKVK